MFREKLTKNPEKRGYLYIRDSFYDRDKRTLKRKPAKLCDGSATKERGKYSKKKDIYCGKIHEISLQKLDTFKQFVENQGKDYSYFKTKSTFDELVDEFVKYVIYVYEIDENVYFEGKKVVYTVGDGYFSPIIINWLKDFKLLTTTGSKEFKRFYYRCEDCGIFDEDVINSLYVKLVPDINTEEIENEINELQEIRMKKQKYEDYRDFMKNNQD